MKIYTRTGDKGETSLFGGQRVAKDALRVEAYGSVDELNAHLGHVAAESQDSELRDLMASIQDRLFVIGAELATPPTGGRGPERSITATDVLFLEGRIDAADAQLPRLTHFVLPGGSPEASRLHIARAVCRRAERACVTLSHAEPLNPSILTFVNRLSDLLFVLARIANMRHGTQEKSWPPGGPDHQ